MHMHIDICTDTFALVKSSGPQRRKPDGEFGDSNWKMEALGKLQVWQTIIAEGQRRVS